jgi:hypothetical protein
MSTILILDDERVFRRLVADALTTKKLSRTQLLRKPVGANEVADKVDAILAGGGAAPPPAEKK